MQDREGWFIGRTTDSGPAFDRLVAAHTPDEWAESVRDHLARIGYAGEGVMLALASSTCLARAATIDDVSLTRDRDALAFAWEVWFPAAAEDLVMDFVVAGHNVLGVAVRWAIIAAQVRALEVRGVAVQSIVPAAILALQSVAFRSAKGRPFAERKATIAPSIVLWGNGDEIELFVLQGGKLADWRIVPADERSLARELQILSPVRCSSQISRRNYLSGTALAAGLTPAPADPPLTITHHLPSELLQVVSDSSSVRLLHSDDCSIQESAIAAACEVLRGVHKPWIEFRRGALASANPHQPARSAIRFAMIAGFVFVLALAVAFLVRSHRYDREVIRCQNERESLFQTVFPGRSVPIGVRSRLESEYARLKGGTGASETPQRVSALATLQGVLASLPDDLRYRVHELRIGGGSVYLDGEVRTHGDADRLAASLRNSGFDVELPHSQQLAGNVVSVQLDARQRGASAAGTPRPLPGDGP